MPERDPSERFDELVEVMLTGAPAARGDASLADLLDVAAELRGLAREEFRERLGADLLRAAASMPKGDAMTTMTIREGFSAITPYLHVPRIGEFLDFVKEAFGAVETMRQAGSGGGLHAEVRIGDSMVMMGGAAGMTARPTALHLYVEDADTVYGRAVAAGAVTLHPPVDQPYGDREASVQDPFGNHWYIATHTAGRGHRPEGLGTITPYLHPVGAPRLIEFLQDAFGGTVVERHESGGMIHNAKVQIGDGMIEMGEAHGQWQPMPAALYLYVDDVDTRYALALSAGGTSLSPPADQPYGDRTAYVQDPAGNTWYIATPRPPHVAG